jgi:hypothetical protein
MNNISAVGWETDKKCCGENVEQAARTSQPVNALLPDSTMHELQIYNATNYGALFFSNLNFFTCELTSSDKQDCES